MKVSGTRNSVGTLILSMWAHEEKSCKPFHFFREKREKYFTQGAHSFLTFITFCGLVFFSALASLFTYFLALLADSFTVESFPLPRAVFILSIEFKCAAIALETGLPPRAVLGVG